jgi:hypothetical protein
MSDAELTAADAEAMYAAAMCTFEYLEEKGLF